MTAFRVQFVVYVEPHGQGRARVGVIAGKARAFKPAKDRQHEANLAALCEPYRPRAPSGEPCLLEGPLLVEITAVLPRPQSLCGRSKRTNEPLQDPRRRLHTSRPDVDNLAKAVLDALKGWWRDDSQVCSLVASKYTAALEETPHYEIRVQTAEGVL